MSIENDNDLRAFLRDADALITGRQLVGSAVADLLSNPDDAATQTRLIKTIASPTIQASNEAAARINASLNEEIPE